MFAVAPIAARQAPVSSDTFAKAKEFYSAASYEEALQVLQSLHGKALASDATLASAYEVFCLVALGRKDQAKVAIEALVKFDPLYHPSDAQASPRVQAFFEDIRRPLIPEIIRRSYADAKSAFDRKDLTTAAAGFDRVIALLDDGDVEDPTLADLRTLATGFRDLTHAAPPKPTTPVVENTIKDPEPAPKDPTPPTAAVQSTLPPAQRVYGPQDPDVRKPVALSRDMPNWTPANSIEAYRTFSGTLELLIGDDGKVLSVNLTKSVLPSYDPVLVKAAQSWKFKPATKNGVPVRYRLGVSVQLGR